MAKFKHNYNKELFEDRKEVFDEVSLTVPDMSYTVRDLLQKFTTGQPVSIQKDGIYEENPSFDYIDPTRLGDFDLSDLVELQNELDELNTNIAAAQQALDEERAAQEAATNEE